eukprot:GHVR01067390.1.p1 GENE.GHVR01067390.1~~GHVR01067390.1.p1  ORF type:complete len:153 (+),score=4.28 GHVR01067390.1:37-495(+)
MMFRSYCKFILLVLPILSIYGEYLFIRLHGVDRCTCDCCVVVNRRPTELESKKIKQDTSFKCAPNSRSIGGNSQNEDHSLCKDTCLLNPEQKTIISDTKTGWIDMKRFCHYECKPSSSYAGAACEIPSKEELKQATEDTGNGKEPNYVPKGN